MNYKKVAVNGGAFIGGIYTYGMDYVFVDEHGNRKKTILDGHYEMDVRRTFIATMAKGGKKAFLSECRKNNIIVPRTVEKAFLACS